MIDRNRTRTRREEQESIFTLDYPKRTHVCLRCKCQNAVAYCGPGRDNGKRLLAEEAFSQTLNTRFVVVPTLNRER